MEYMRTYMHGSQMELFQEEDSKIREMSCTDKKKKNEQLKKKERHDMQGNKIKVLQEVEKIVTEL